MFCNLGNYNSKFASGKNFCSSVHVYLKIYYGTKFHPTCKCYHYGALQQRSMKGAAVFMLIVSRRLLVESRYFTLEKLKCLGDIMPWERKTNKHMYRKLSHQPKPSSSPIIHCFIYSMCYIYFFQVVQTYEKFLVTNLFPLTACKNLHVQDAM